MCLKATVAFGAHGRYLRLVIRLLAMVDSGSSTVGMSLCLGSQTIVAFGVDGRYQINIL